MARGSERRSAANSEALLERPDGGELIANDTNHPGMFCFDKM